MKQFFGATCVSHETYFLCDVSLKFGNFCYVSHLKKNLLWHALGTFLVSSYQSPILPPLALTEVLPCMKRAIVS
jgi:hypothetical protein